MKTGRLTSILGAGVVALAGCASPGNGITTISVVGPPGQPIRGSYVQEGQRVPVAATLPFSMAHANLTEFEIQKATPDEELSLVAQNDNSGWHSEVASSAGDGITGLRLHMQNGMSVQKIKPSAP